MRSRWVLGFLAVGISVAVAAAAGHKAQVNDVSKHLTAIKTLKPHVLAQNSVVPVQGYANNLDLAIADNYNFVLAQLGAAGITPPQYPALYSSLSLAPMIYTRADALKINLPQAVSAAVDQDTTNYNLVPINLLSANATGSTFGVTATTSVPYNPIAVANTVGIYTLSGDVVTPPQAGIAIGVPITLQTLATAAMPATPTEYNANGIYIYVYPASVLGAALMQQLGLTADEPVAVAGVLNTDIAEDDGTTVITNLAPTNVKGGPYIKICIARGDGDCDYSYARASNGDFILQIPLNGNVQFPVPIQVDPNTGKPAEAQYSVAFWFPQVSGGCAMPHTDFASQVVPNNTVLSWNIADAQFGALSPDAGCHVPYGVTQDAVFQITMNVQNTDGNMMPATITSQQGPTVANTLRIEPVKVVYGCLPPGTMISRADGSASPIEDFKHGDKLRSGSGTITVDNYMTGDEKHPLYRISTANGFHARMTEMHPTPTGHGIKLAKTLKAGDVVTTLKGPSRIVKVETMAYNGKVWNLDAGLRGEAAEHNVDRETFFADGILVGGARMQMHYAVLERDSEASVLARLPKAWRTDYESFKKRNQSMKHASKPAPRT